MLTRTCTPDQQSQWKRIVAKSKRSGLPSLRKVQRGYGRNAWRGWIAEAHRSTREKMPLCDKNGTCYRYRIGLPPGAGKNIEQAMRVYKLLLDPMTKPRGYRLVPG